ncbi:hypothetical protein BZM27_04635 [Paraburkholderia steynii]|uniref:Uncharacterized protein n=1 Tax=Paraburkholderia steynii TaxID=1245441 RepID=A0A4R0XL23_9BURK|nr:hypothetical protein BZM27_04635 [Paraburkholderia steynii]
MRRRSGNDEREDTTMQLQIGFPDTVPLHGIERDAFEAKLRDALHYVFDGRRVRQLAEQVDVRRPFEPSDVLPLRRIGDEHTFEQCMTLDRCRFDDMSMALRRVVMHAIGARLGLELAESGIATGIVSQDEGATNRLAPKFPLPLRHGWTGFAALAIAAGTAVSVLATATTMWKIARPAATASMVATVVSTSPAQTLRDLAGSVPDDRRPYRVSVQVEPQGTDTGQH